MNQGRDTQAILRSPADTRHGFNSWIAPSYWGYDHRSVRVAWLAVVVACAHPLARTPVLDGPEQGSHDRHYTIWLGGARVGTATESETWSREGVVLRRDETMQFFRGDAL